MEELSPREALVFARWEEQNGICPVCGLRIPPICTGGDRPVLHHIHNRKDGGPDTASNLQLRHRACEQRAHREDRDGNPEQARYTYRQLLERRAQLSAQ
jgi:hypothetical protein